MARLESIAVGGYYPTPEHVVPRLAALLDAGPRHSFLDPCAGEGAAILSLIASLQTDNASVYAVELEKTRHHTLETNLGDRFGYSTRNDALHGDAFKVSFIGEGVSCLYLNPPYDTDPQHGRLEERFLARFAAALAPSGVLVYLVPFYALKASARTLATQFTGVSCYRFPDEDFAAYKQVALFAYKRATPLWEPDPALEAEVLAWAADATTIPPLEGAGDRYSLPGTERYTRPFSEWVVRPLDFRALLDATAPWCVTDRSGKRAPIPGIVPEGALEDLLVRRYPIAMPPRAAHIAAGIATGVFNGARLSPDDATNPLPELLIKGVFDKEFRTVDEKKDKEGNTKALIQVQQPKLVTTVLDLSTSTYVTIKPSTDVTHTADVATMTMADLLAVYGRGLMQVMLQQCPVLHDPTRPADEIPLPELARPLYQAQRHATMAAVKLLGGPGRARRCHAAFILGEIGSGKTSVALATAQAVRAKRTLVMCPPHLLTSWQDQIAAVVPWVRAVVLSDVGDVSALAADTSDVPTIAILSRETAKLGHAYAAVERCGTCGTVPKNDVDHAKKRSTCEGRKLVIRGKLGRPLKELALDLLHVFPGDLQIRQLFRGPIHAAANRWTEASKADPTYADRAWARLVSRGNLDRVLEGLIADGSPVALDLLATLLWADPDPEILLGIARALYAVGVASDEYGPRSIEIARQLLLVVPDVDVSEFRALDAQRKQTQYGSDPWIEWEKHRRVLSGEEIGSYWNPFNVKRDDEGHILRGPHVLGDRRVAVAAFAELAQTQLAWGRECGAPLYQAIPEPRRYPLATYIAKRTPDLFDLLILDEGHEYSTDGSAQERSAHRLTSLGIPTLLLTGTVMNGYAESLFTNMWACSADFRREFARDERTRFIDRFGYRKRLVEDRDKESGKVVEYGSMSDRVERAERMIGDAPGVLPLFLLKYLLPLSVTLHKTDLAIDIPKCTEVTTQLTPETKQGNQFRDLQAKLLAQISKDRFAEGLAGKLWGAMAEMPSYLDLATEDVGNTDDGRYEIRYPETAGGQLVASVDPLPASVLLPKEAWLIEHVQAALAADRNVLVFAWHVKLLPRLARLIKEYAGTTATILVPSKVPTAKRETWINQEVINKKRRVLLANPITVQTGLNNLVYFADEVWLENPACNPVVYRQAVGRVDRIGQKKPTKIVFPLYAGTSQVELHSLLMQKVAVSMSADGLDGESAMQAAGVGDDSGFSSFAVGRQLYELLSRDAREAA